jgi:hypothetical protein
MATITATDVNAPNVLGLTTDGDKYMPGIYLSWNMPASDLMFGVEIWSSYLNNRSTATLLATVIGTNHYIDYPLANAVQYYWIRGVTIFGKATGAWYPFDNNGGIIGVDYQPFATHNLQSLTTDLDSDGTWQNVLVLNAYNPGPTLTVTASVSVSLQLACVGSFSSQFRWNYDDAVPNNLITYGSIVTATSSLDILTFGLPINLPTDVSLATPYIYRLQYQGPAGGLATISNRSAMYSWDYVFSEPG